MVLNEAGSIVANCLARLPQSFPGIRIDAHVVMPNHVHAILYFGIPRPSATDPTLGSVVRYWKAGSCETIRSTVDPCFGWQPNYYERILRDEDETDRIRRYIAENPANWEHDEERPQS